MQPSTSPTTAPARLAEVEVDMPAAVQTIRGTLEGIWGDFLTHLPFLLTGIIVLVVTAVAALLIRAAVWRTTNRPHIRRSMSQLLGQMSFVGVWIVGILIAAIIVFPGMTPTKALGALGLLSVAIGFAFKDIFENFFAGILMLWRFPFEPGDYIECQDIAGRVEEITIRLTTLRKPTDELVVLPNSFLFGNPVHVLTYEDRRRIEIIVGVAYSENVAEAVAVIEQAVRECQTASRDHPVEVFPQEFADSGVNIQVAWWCLSTQLGERRSRAEVITAVKAALDARGIEIPFPYRTLTFKQPLRVPTTAEDSAPGEEAD